MASILLYGGLLRNTNIYHIPINILLKKSSDWLNGNIMINDEPVYHINSNKNNYIEINKTNNTTTLMLNDKIIYDHKDLFDFSVKVELNPYITNTPYANFFKYYQSPRV